MNNSYKKEFKVICKNLIVNESKLNFVATSLSISINALIMSFKLSVGYIFGSISLVADGFDSLLDLFSASFAGIGEKVSKKPPDSSHPFGHEKYQLVFSLAISIILFFSAYLIASDAIQRLKDKFLLEFKWIILIAASVSIVSKLFLSIVNFRIGKRLNSPVIIANAKNYRTDTISSVLVIVSLIGSYYKIWWFDSTAAFIIVLLIFYTGYEIVKVNLPELMDKGPPEEIVKKVQEIALSVNGVKEVHLIRLRSILNVYTGDFHILVDPEISIREGHDIAEMVQSKIEETGLFRDLLIHIEPFLPEESLRKI